MIKSFVKLGAAASAMLALGGCATVPNYRNEPSVSQVYDSVYRQGSRDSVAVLRQALQSSGLYGSTDPYVPIRVPDQIIPIWVPAHTNPDTGNYVGGHWDQSVVRLSHWLDQSPSQ